MSLIIVGAAMGGRLASLDIIHLILQAGWVVQLVLALLLAMSVASWAIIVSKWRELKRAEQDSEAFLQAYHEGSFERVHDTARKCEDSPLAAVFLAGYGELRRIQKYAGGRGEALDESQIEAVSRQIAWSASREELRLEHRLNVLATTGSSAPFIGLFGTVVGIINAFESIGRSGAASLAVVAPGIAEALIATAVGLLAAIPATIFYNHFVAELRRLDAATDLFTTELDRDVRSLAVAAPKPAARAARE
jgi:biopolymer transport protein TolQ